MSDTPKDAKSIFLAALDIADASERASFVATACAGDEALRQRVEDLLRAYGQPDGPLEKLAAAVAPTELGEPIREQVGATIGPYKLMEQIGEGGFGLVFVAEQERPIRRKVALKIIKPGMDTPDVIARFEAERQALALMDHPNIARVLDAGTTQSGRPYFVMELVRGIPITEYCDQAQLTPRERLELFVPVCNAIQHAHLKGIIHRDVKPSNVLVTMHDARPVVKVIDFGVAKALHQQLTDRTIYTRFAQMIGTPLYMSPEQAQMSGLDIDTRSDIYSLGVLFYELLTGSTPLDKRRLAKAAYDELLKIIREEEPPKPSLRLSQSGDALPSIAAQRKTEPAKLSKMFSGDLDWIAMKALEKDRTRRYETANAFAADVLRYLDDEPVEASPPSAVYRMRKFARKYRKPVIAMAVIGAVLVVGIGGTTWGLVRARRAEQAARVAEEIAIGSEQKAVDALMEVTRKETTLRAEVAVREQAERQVTVGLLSPMGVTDEVNVPERHSYFNWSAIKEPRLRLRILETALADPETALRVSRRADWVIQSCVGMSLTGRAQAIKLLSAKQQESSANPRVRVAACRLALELGSTDVPGWAESCAFLSDPKNGLTDRFGDFVTASIRETDSKELLRFRLERLLNILERSPSYVHGTGREVPDESSPEYQVASSLCAAFDTLMQRLDPADVEHIVSGLVRALDKADAVYPVLLWNTLLAASPLISPGQTGWLWDAVVAIGEKNRLWLGGPSPLGPLAQRLDEAQIGPAADMLLKSLDRSPTLVLAGVSALAPHLDPLQARRAWEAIFPLTVEVSTGRRRIYDLSHVLTALSPRLPSEQVRTYAADVIRTLERSPRDRDLARALFGLSGLAPRLEAGEVRRAAAACIVLIEKSPEDGAEGLAALAPCLERRDIKRAWAALAVAMQKSTRESAYGLGQRVKELVERLPAAEASQAADSLLQILESSDTSGETRELALVGLSGVAPRLASSKAERAWTASRAILVHPASEGVLVWRAADALNLLAERVPRETVTDSFDQISDVLYKQHIEHRALGELTSRLTARKVNGALDSFIAHVAEVGSDYGRIGLRTIAPRLDEVQAKRTWDAAIAARPSASGDTAEELDELLGALAPRLERTRRDEMLIETGKHFLDSGESDVPFVSSISSPQSVARLLSHPACVGEARTRLLLRFEELILYGGKPVFSRSDDPGGKQPSHEQSPPRRFHNLHDAAVWIQQNWPDFDLETNCPATWRGSR
jgi:serine/threonine protein kinase